MLIPKCDETRTAGMLDVLIICCNVRKDTYQVVFYEECPTPGVIRFPDEVTTVRLKRNVQYSTAASTWEGAQQQLAQCAGRSI